MNNDIKYFYDIEITRIHRKDSRYIIESDNIEYCLEICDDYVQIISDIYKQNNYMLSHGIPVYQIIPNRFQSIITKINNINYILMIINNNWDKIINIDDLYNYQYPYLEKQTYLKNDWKKLWMNKIDYFEYQMSQYGIKYPLIRESMPYFVGLSENAISMLNEINIQVWPYFQHRRINSKSILYDLMNPLNIIIDVKTRDICEFYKSSILNKEEKEITEYLKKNNYSSDEIIYFYIRLFFPTFYFDMYEEILSINSDDGKITKILDQIDKYQTILKKDTLTIGKYVAIPDVEWVKKN